MFNPDIADRVIESRPRLETNLQWDGGVMLGLVSYFMGIFAADLTALYADEGGGTADDESADLHEAKLLVPMAYSKYIAELAWGGPGVPVHTDAEEQNENMIGFEEWAWFLRLALAIARKQGIRTEEVVRYYRSRAKWMPAHGTTWATVAEQLTTRRRQVEADANAA